MYAGWETAQKKGIKKMKTMKQIAFEQALYYKDEYNRLKKQFGEENEAARIKFIQYSTVKSIIDESGYTEEWDLFIKKVFLARQEFEALQK